MNWLKTKDQQIVKYSDSEVWELARFIHDIYEEEASKNGWETQKTTRVAFENLPKENRATMLNVAAAVLNVWVKKTKIDE